MPVIGIDCGSVAIKGVLVHDDKLLCLLKEPAGADQTARIAELIGRLNRELPQCGEIPVCATGYGRELVPGASFRVSEIFANALGAGWAWRNWGIMPEIARRFGETEPFPAERTSRFRTIIDVGGQDSKVITFSPEGVVDGFAMNDRCAAGTGRFLQELSSVLEVDNLQEMDALALEDKGNRSISSTCTVFAESEVISLISNGVSRSDISGCIFSSVADRLAELTGSLNWEGPVLFDGGPARLRSLRKLLAARLVAEVAVPSCPQHITAIGAAVYLDSYKAT